MGLIDRAKNILLQPKEEWAVIAQEPPNTGALISGYAVPLILLSAICSLVGVAFITGAGIVIGLVSAVAMLIIALIAVTISAYIVNALAPTFNSQPDLGRAFQLVVYAATPAWVAGILNIFPPLAFVTWIAGLYGIYLMYLGLPYIMKTPEDKRIIYVIVAWLVGALITGILTVIFAGIVTGMIVAGAAAAGATY